MNAQTIEQVLEDIKETQRARAEFIQDCYERLDRLDAALERADAHLERTQKAADLYWAKYGK